MPLGAYKGLTASYFIGYGLTGAIGVYTDNSGPGIYFRAGVGLGLQGSAGSEAGGSIGSMAGGALEGEVQGITRSISASVSLSGATASTGLRTPQRDSDRWAPCCDIHKHLECRKPMPVATKICGGLILVGYLVFGMLGIFLEYVLAEHTRGLPNPVDENAILTQRGRRLFRWDRLWRRSRTPVWLAIPVLGWFLCGRCA